MFCLYMKRLDNTILQILTQRKPNRLREYHALLAHKPLSIVRAELGCYVPAENDNNALARVESVYPSDRYAILSLRQTH